MAALLGSRRLRADLRFVVFDVPYLIGVDLRGLSWQERRERLELLAKAFDLPLELSPLVEPSIALVEEMADGRLEGIVPPPTVMDRGQVGRRSRSGAGTNGRHGGSTDDPRMGGLARWQSEETRSNADARCGNPGSLAPS